MSIPSERAASSTLVPLGAFTSRPSIFSVTSSLMASPFAARPDGSRSCFSKVRSLAWLAHSPVTLSPDHVQHAERGNDVGDVGVLDQLRQRLHDGEAGRAHAALVGPPGSVGDDVEAE